MYSHSISNNSVLRGEVKQRRGRKVADVFPSWKNWTPAGQHALFGSAIGPAPRLASSTIAPPVRERERVRPDGWRAAALRANRCAHPTTGLRQIGPESLGPLASSLRSLSVPLHRRNALAGMPAESENSERPYA